MTRPDEPPSTSAEVTDKTSAPKPAPAPAQPPKAMPKEIGGPTGPEPTRYNDWERKGRVSDF